MSRPLLANPSRAYALDRFWVPDWLYSRRGVLKLKYRDAGFIANFTPEKSFWPSLLCLWSISKALTGSVTFPGTARNRAWRYTIGL
jgi:hypothetical protein